MATRANRSDTATEILDVAQRLVQTRGYNGFSYADVAGEIGTTTAALHYHFPSKSDLGAALVLRYSESFLAALARIDGELDAGLPRLAAYRDLYLDVLDRRRLCLCGMLSAEAETLPEPMRAGIVSFFDANTDWLRSVIEEGESRGTIIAPLGAPDTAEAIVAGFEGAMLVAWSRHDPKGFLRTTDLLLESLLRSPAPA